MATCPPRQKIFGGTRPSTTLIMFAGISIVLSVFLTITLSVAPVSGEVSLDPDFIKINEFPDHNFHGRVPRGFTPVDSDQARGYNSPVVIEGEGGGNAKDAYETLRQLSLASTQSFIRRRLFNTSVALTVPLFSFTLPQRAAEGSTVDLANQAIFGLFALLVVMMVFAVPVLFTGIRPFNVAGRSNTGDDSEIILNTLLHSDRMINLMGADMRNKIGLNPEKCLQKSICDAHKHPKKYGLFALPFQLFAPPPSKEKETGKSISRYQEAASIGQYSKVECWDKYNCFFDFLDLAVYLLDWFNSAAKQDETQVNT